MAAWLRRNGDPKWNPIYFHVRKSAVGDSVSVPVSLGATDNPHSVSRAWSSTLTAICEEHPEDIGAIRAVNDDTFGQTQEGRLADVLRSNGGVLLSLAAVLNGRVVGHILYSPVTLRSGSETVVGAGLAPMAVLPEFQRQGIGRMLIERGNEMLRATGCPFVVVLGHPGYYPRFGFRPASGYGIRCEWEVPDDVFMVLVMDAVKMKGVAGLARYRDEFSGII